MAEIVFDDLPHIFLLYGEHSEHKTVSALDMSDIEFHIWARSRLWVPEYEKGYSWSWAERVDVCNILWRQGNLPEYTGK